VRGAELDSALAGLDDFRAEGGIVEPSRIPGVKPAFEALYVGADGRIWTFLHSEGDALSPPPQETWLDVFDPDGVYRGLARADARLEPFQPTPVFTATHAYAVAVDDLGVQHVVRLRIEPTR
jgi:hypothetical protein